MNDVPARTSALNFLRTELKTGLTFVVIAEQARDAGKIKRYVENARKACQSVRHFAGRVSLSASESAELHEKLAELERRLRLLEKAG